VQTLQKLSLRDLVREDGRTPHRPSPYDPLAAGAAVRSRSFDNSSIRFLLYGSFSMARRGRGTESFEETTSPTHGVKLTNLCNTRSVYFPADRAPRFLRFRSGAAIHAEPPDPGVGPALHVGTPFEGPDLIPHHALEVMRRSGTWRRRRISEPPNSRWPSRRQLVRAPYGSRAKNRGIVRPMYRESSESRGERPAAYSGV
jgi:hypothetical protein